MLAAAILSIATLGCPPPSDATLAAYAAKSAEVHRPAIVYPDYVFRVWTADWCQTCRSAEWQATISQLDAIPGVGIQVVHYDRFRAYARNSGITGLPAVQIFEVRGGKMVNSTATVIGKAPFLTLRRLIPNGIQRRKTSQANPR